MEALETATARVSAEQPLAMGSGRRELLAGR